MSQKDGSTKSNDLGADRVATRFKGVSGGRVIKVDRAQIGSPRKKPLHPRYDLPFPLLPQEGGRGSCILGCRQVPWSRGGSL